MDALAPGAVLAGYRVESVLGRGGMGVVYRATQLALERLVALKVIAAEHATDASFRQRFQREARIAASIDHPHVVAVYDVGESDGLLFMVLQLVQAQDLRKLIRRQGRLSPDVTLRIATQIGAALDAAHACGIVHRDVKPGNVLVAGSPGAEHAYLTDFGIATLPGAGALTATGRAMGTCGYIAPEVLRGARADSRADIYALGCVLFEALTGSPPFPGETEAAVIAGHLSEPVPSVLDRLLALPAWGDELVGPMLAKAPEDRPACAANVLDRIAASMESRGAEPSRGVVQREEGRARWLGRLPVRTNIPNVQRSLVGREQELRSLVAWLRGPDSRLVTLVGAGGVGKTSLALVAARELIADHRDGVFQVELEALTDANQVPAAIERTVGLSGEAGSEPLARLIEHFGQRRSLLVLDNFEHLLDAAGDVAELVAASTALNVLATSQAPLRVRSERVFPVKPLALPAGADCGPEALAEIPSVRLLIERAQAADPSFTLSCANAAAVAQLCKRLDGLPLALELAAARLTLLDPAGLLARLEEGTDALGRGSRDLPARQRGLRAVLAWTTDQLSEPQRDLFARLSVFAGGFTVEQAEALSGREALDDLETLRDLSLLRRHGRERLTMPPPVRVDARTKLRAAGLEEATRARHAEIMLEFARPLGDGWRQYFVERLRLLRPEADNLREALHWSRTADRLLHASLIEATEWWFYFAGHARFAIAELEHALASDTDPLLRGRLLLAYANSVAPARAEAEYRSAIELLRAHGDAPTLCEALACMAAARAMQGDGAGALAAAHEARDVALALSDPRSADVADLALGQALLRAGDKDAAERVWRALAGRAHAGSHEAFGSVSFLADLALDRGDANEALASYCHLLIATRAAGGSPGDDALQLDGAAMALAAQGRHEEALMTAAISDRLRREFSCDVPPVEWLTQREHTLRSAHASLGPAAEEACRQRVARLGLEAAINWAIALDTSPATAA